MDILEDLGQRRLNDESHPGCTVRKDGTTPAQQEGRRYAEPNKPAAYWHVPLSEKATPGTDHTSTNTRRVPQTVSLHPIPTNNRETEGS